MSKDTINEKDKSDKIQDNNPKSNLSFWQRYEAPILLTTVGGAIDTIAFVGLLGFFTNHVTGNLVMAGGGFVKEGEGLWIKLGALPVFLIAVVISKRFIAKSNHSDHILSNLLFAEVVCLTAFLIAAVLFGPFQEAGAIDLAITGFLGLIAFAIRNTAGKTVMSKVRPTLLMTGNTTQLGIDLSDYIFDRTSCNMDSLKHSATVVTSFTLGALVGTLLYIQVGLWAIAPFILPVLYLAFAVRDESYRQRQLINL
ncbi:YoaK family protein [Psychrobacter sp.]|uniref:YoaK family protein n=1 Tax=Psychrobacter sp. TaxID=56811 RepID=UPI0025D8437F|nr:YoaK family protein [Psychrobacter sp.]